jgi:flagellin
MSMVINTNLASDNAVRILGQTSRATQTAMERLTSGLRINKTADDAGGAAVVVRMDSQVNGTNMAVRNSQDGINLIQTMDGSAKEVVSMLQRVRELGIQAANGTYSSAQRTQMNTEVTQLKDEVNRIAKTTKFNGIPLMNGSKAVLSFQVGWETGATNQIAVSTINFSTGKLKVGSASIATQAKALSAVGKVDIDLSNITNIRSKWGAVQNRFQHTISNLNNVNQNIIASRSQIQDTNFAKESAALAKDQVLQQAGMSMLTQANQNSKQVLSLLR